MYAYICTSALLVDVFSYYLLKCVYVFVYRMLCLRKIIEKKKSAKCNTNILQWRFLTRFWLFN